MKTAFTAALLLLAASAHAETTGEKTGVNSVLGIAPTTADFVKEAAITDMFEIQSSKLAEAQSDDATKTFAAQMITDHSKTTDELKPLAQAENISVPTALDSAHQSKLDKLQSLKGADFTKQYREDQDSGHKDAVSLFERYGKSGDDAKLKAFANATLPTIKMHAQMATNLDR